MWYRKFATKPTKPTQEAGYEEKIVRDCAEREIRRKLYLMGEHNPPKKQMMTLMKRVLKSLKDEYESFDNIRLHMAGESLTPAVVKAVNKILKSR